MLNESRLREGDGLECVSDKAWITVADEMRAPFGLSDSHASRQWEFRSSSDQPPSGVRTANIARRSAQPCLNSV
ncbi:hypothetical protein K474DRAFT_696658 [Panus rudis PR-1116 ss-1]|nr:hypothetical protein K474DRAFT_696658 [Panus rudis PR-1116 ss-1]